MLYRHYIYEAKREKLPPGRRGKVEWLSAQFEQPDTRAITGAQCGAMHLWKSLKIPFLRLATLVFSLAVLRECLSSIV